MRCCPQVNALVAAWTAAPGPQVAALAPGGVWLRLLGSGKSAAPALMESFFEHFTLEQLLACTDPHGRKALDLATPACKAVLASKLYLGGVYELDTTQLVHQSATCKVLLALDHSAGEREEKELKEGEANASTAPRKVALKFMRDKEQWRRELEARSGGAGGGEAALNPAFVVGVIRAHDGPADPNFCLDLHARQLGDYPFVLAMPRADRSLADVLKHEHLAPSPDEVHWDEVRHIAVDVAAAVAHLHGRRIIHGDVKPLNLMRTDKTWRLIDLDAATTFGHAAGAKSSAAFCAPEMVQVDAATGMAHIAMPSLTPASAPVTNVVKANDADGAVTKEEAAVAATPAASCATAVPASAVPAGPELDLWAFGAVLYQLCTGSALFAARNDDTLDAQGLLQLKAWSVADVKARTAVIRNRTARHLVASLLAPDPRQRLPLEQVLKHPFLTNEPVKGRLKGEEPYYDAFIGYRVATDRATVQELFRHLTRRGFRVFWDKLCLAAGRDWEEGFCDGLVQSRVLVPVLSEAALYSGNKRGDLSLLTAESACDNVVLEHAMALELRRRELLEGVLPVRMDGKVSAARVADVCVRAIDAKLAAHLAREGLGAPLEPHRTARATVQAILDGDGPPVDGADLAAAATWLGNRLRDAFHCAPRFDVCISFRGGCEDDATTASELCDLLVARGVRAVAAPASVDAAALLTHTPTVLVCVESSAALAPLGALQPDSPCDPVSVEWAVAVALQQRERLRFIFPVFLGDLMKEEGKQERLLFGAWGGGSNAVVAAEARTICELLDDTGTCGVSSKETVRVVNASQGQKVGGGEELTLQAAADEVRGILDRSMRSRTAEQQLREAEIEAAVLKHQLNESKIRPDSKSVVASAPAESTLSRMIAPQAVVPAVVPTLAPEVERAAPTANIPISTATSKNTAAGGAVSAVRILSSRRLLSGPAPAKRKEVGPTCEEEKEILCRDITSFLQTARAKGES